MLPISSGSSRPGGATFAINFAVIDDGTNAIRPGKFVRRFAAASLGKVSIGFKSQLLAGSKFFRSIALCGASLSSFASFSRCLSAARLRRAFIQRIAPSAAPITIAPNQSIGPTRLVPMVGFFTDMRTTTSPIGVAKITTATGQRYAIVPLCKNLGGRSITAMVAGSSFNERSMR